MAQITITGVITAVSTALLALTALVGAVAGLIPLVRRSKRTEIAVVHTEALAVKTLEVGQGVHTLVNQQSTDKMNYIAALQRTIISMGGTVPIDQSMGAIPEELK